LTANAYKRTGYTFAGWNTKADGSGKTYKNKASVKNLTTKNGKTLTLYAQWTANTYTVKFNGNGATSGTMKSSTKTYGKTYTLAANAFKRTGYTFAGWNTKKDGSGTTYKNKASVKNLTSTDGKTVTLYAQWTANTYTVAFDGNGANYGTMKSLTKTYDKTYTLTANAYTRTGYKFTGWNTKADGSGTTYKNKASIKNLTSTNGKTVTLYAQWTATVPTTGEKNALASAKDYLRVDEFSHDGLVDQLEYEGYTHSEAVYGADLCGADWYEQAVKCAKSYLKVDEFSRSGLIDQLEYEGFTSDQAVYGVDHCGAEWNEQAAKCAKSYLKIMSFSRSELIDQLEYEGFTYDQAVYGAEQNGY
jgi:uncharacterized repeat protein (TIGR02543 family)